MLWRPRKQTHLVTVSVSWVWGLGVLGLAQVVWSALRERPTSQEAQAGEWGSGRRKTDSLKIVTGFLTISCEILNEPLRIVVFHKVKENAEWQQNLKKSAVFYNVLPYLEDSMFFENIYWRYCVSGAQRRRSPWSPKLHLLWLCLNISFCC